MNIIKKIAYIGYKIQEKYNQGVSNDEDSELLNFLIAKGMDIKYVVWNDTAIDWTIYDLIIIKSPWDYHENIEAFYAWLDKIDGLGIRMLNPLDIVRWNSNKRYLNDIVQAGLPVIATVYIDKGSTMPKDHSIFEKFDTDKIVVKPCISAGAKSTIVIDKNNYFDKVDSIDVLLSKEEFMVQPFVKEIENGEWSFLFFNGEYSHGALKVPMAGDFRVQHHFGGSYTYPEPDAHFISQAERYVRAFAKGTLYARVDGIIIDDKLFLMELELIEPYLFLNTDLARQEKYYQSLITLL